MLFTKAERFIDLFTRSGQNTSGHASYFLTIMYNIVLSSILTPMTSNWCRLFRKDNISRSYSNKNLEHDHMVIKSARL